MAVHWLTAKPATRCTSSTRSRSLSRDQLLDTRSTTDVGGWHQFDARSEPDVGGWHQLDLRRTWAAGTNSIYDGRGRLAPTRYTIRAGRGRLAPTRYTIRAGRGRLAPARYLTRSRSLSRDQLLDTRSTTDVGGWHQLGTFLDLDHYRGTYSPEARTPGARESRLTLKQNPSKTI